MMVTVSDYLIKYWNAKPENMLLVNDFTTLVACGTVDNGRRPKISLRGSVAKAYPG